LVLQAAQAEAVSAATVAIQVTVSQPQQTQVQAVVARQPILQVQAAQAVRALCMSGLRFNYERTIFCTN
jgi:hypothetical protein